MVQTFQWTQRDCTFGDSHICMVNRKERREGERGLYKWGGGPGGVAQCPASELLQYITVVCLKPFFSSREGGGGKGKIF